MLISVGLKIQRLYCWVSAEGNVHSVNCVLSFAAATVPETHIYTILQLCAQLGTQLNRSYFEFKIRLIRLGLPFLKQKFLYSNSQPTNCQSGSITIAPKSQLRVGDKENISVAFSHA